MAKTYKSEDIEFPLQKIEMRDMEKEVKTSFIEYSMSVITSRALPDVRDGMKPGQRRILYAMYEDNLTFDRPFRKSATTVGNVLGRYHPHGDASVYDAMVRLAQPFSLRYPLVEGHGNFGNIDGDPAEAYRYTEARMSRLADEMMADIEKEGVTLEVMTKTGVITQINPKRKVAEGALAAAKSLAVEFGMTPSSRSRVSAILNDNTPKDEFAEFEEIDE